MFNIYKQISPKVIKTAYLYNIYAVIFYIYTQNFFIAITNSIHSINVIIYTLI